MSAYSAIEEYKKDYGIVAIKDVGHLKGWLERKYRKRMTRPLFIALGKGGGQTYKTLWEVFDSRNNANKPCYYFNSNWKACKELGNSGHLPLQHWVDDDSPHLKF